MFTEYVTQFSSSGRKSFQNTWLENNFFTEKTYTSSSANRLIINTIWVWKSASVSGFIITFSSQVSGP